MVAGMPTRRPVASARSARNTGWATLPPATSSSRPIFPRWRAGPAMLWVGPELARARITTSPAFRAFAFRPWDPGPFGPESLRASEDMSSPSRSGPFRRGLTTYFVYLVCRHKIDVSVVARNGPGGLARRPCQLRWRRGRAARPEWPGPAAPGSGLTPQSWKPGVGNRCRDALPEIANANSVAG